MLCEVFASYNFGATWLFLIMLGTGAILMSSGVAFMMYYVNPTYEQWRWKTNPKYPSAEAVKQEIQKTMKGVLVATFCPAMSIYLAANGLSHAYCGVTPEYDLSYMAKQFFALWIITDFYEFFYHYLGHKYDATWENHKSHHRFFNPSPFAVIADDLIDQFFRSLPLLLFPMLVPINIDMMFAQWGILFYFYGTYLHWGYESQYISAHNVILNTAYDHHLHHAKSIKNKPIRTGFFFKIWDDIAGAKYQGDCFCVRCQHAQGKRTAKEWKEIVVPDYSVLLNPSFWSTTNAKTLD